MQGRLTRNQKFVLRGYRQRYNVHDIFAKLDTLKHLVDYSTEPQYIIDPQYTKSVYRFLSRELSG